MTSPSRWLVSGFCLSLAACNSPLVTSLGGLTPASSPSATPTGQAPTPTGTPIAASGCPGTGNSTIGNSGGTADCLSFALVGDTRPGAIDSTSDYPTPIITAIFQDLEAMTPKIPFAIGTGDYQFATDTGTQGAVQVGYYATARANYQGLFFPAMGNHECTGDVAANCGIGNADGITNNYTAFASSLLTPIGKTLPYYSVNVAANDASWTAKFVVIAANAWDTAQATWLDQALSQPTTYTFVVRHESTTVTCPGCTASEDIIKAHPFTMRLVGHAHDLSYVPGSKELVDGIGGAPITGSSNYGYVIGQQRADGAIVFTAYDYQTKAVMLSFVVRADGTATN